ncbi:hypothetical protein QFC20_003294 [Naganishia adeliensis]|uniref:Uncharacterized protein n=1 Tax=Naganishia adeliensis TaxID=92952 RepID=A0ACC2WDR2_9TREE|nr:hypothetical protein QFC20_003294 [Naganishia adeliensis]
MADTSPDIIPLLDATSSVPDLLNSLLSPSADLHDLEKRVLALGTRLALITQDTSTSLERTIAEISRTVPRLGWDLQYLRDGADEVRNVLGHVQGKIGTTQEKEEEEEDDEKVLKRLEYLDTVKTRMESARDVLKEAESWSTLEPQVHTYLSDPPGDTSDAAVAGRSYLGIRKAARRLRDARTSLQVFRKTPAEWNARNRLLTSLEDEAEQRLTTLLEHVMERDGEPRETMMRSGKDDLASLGAQLDDAARRLVPALSSVTSAVDDDLGRVPTIGAIHMLFHDISRRATFIDVYFRHRRKSIEDLWTNVELVEEVGADDSSQATKTSAFLKTFYAELLRILRAERTNLPALFADVPAPTEEKQTRARANPLELLVGFLHTALASLSPSLPQRLDRIISYSGNQALAQLIPCWVTSRDFARDVETLLGEMYRAERDKILATETKNDTTGLRSRRNSISSVSGRPPSVVFSSSPSAILDQSPLATAGGGGTRSRSGSISSAVDPGSIKRHQRRYSRAGPTGLLGVDALAHNAAGGMYPQRQQTDELAQGLPVDWDIPIYDPYAPFISDYAALQRRLVLDSYGNDPTFKSVDETDTPSTRGMAKLLRERAEKAQQMSRQIKGRAETFTASWGVVEAIENTSNLFALVIKDSEKDIQTTLKNNSGAGSGSVDAASKGIVDDSLRDELDDLAGFEGDGGTGEGDVWAGFTTGLEVLAGVRELARTLDETAKEATLWVKHLGLQDGSAETGLTKGGRKVLVQSTLNSMARTALLDSQDLTSHIRPARDAIDQLTVATQRQLISLLLTTPYDILRSYPSLPVWSQQDKQPRRAPGMPNLQVPTFSRSPTDEMTRVTETVLGVLRVLELCAGEEDSIMSWEIGKLEGVQEEMLLEALQTRDGSGANTSDETEGLDAKTLFPTTTSHALSLADAPQPTPIPTEIVLQAWITSLTLTLLGHVTRDVLPSFSRPLSSTGVAQLNADLAYLSNAMRALDVESADMERWRRALECANESELRAAMQDMGDDGLPIAKTVQELRGWT